MIEETFFRAALQMLTKDEDSRSVPYDDKTGSAIKLSTGGCITIGIGRNLTDRGLSKDEILYIFNNDLALVMEDARHIFPEFSWYSFNRQLGIVNLLFNLGRQRFERFIMTIAAIKAQDWPGAGDRLRDSRWYMQVGARGPRVVRLIQDDINEY